MDGYSRYLVTRPIPDKRARTVAAATHNVMCTEMAYPTRITAEKGSEFVAMDTLAAPWIPLGNPGFDTRMIWGWGG